MGCSSFNGYTCNVTGDSCMFFIPNSKLCAEVYNEGPDSDNDKCEDCKYFFIKDGRRCCSTKPFYHEPRTELLDDDLISCGGFKKRDIREDVENGKKETNTGN